MSEITEADHVVPNVVMDRPTMHEDSPKERTWRVVIGQPKQTRSVRISGDLHDIHAVRNAAEHQFPGEPFVSAEEIYPAIAPAE